MNVRRKKWVTLLQIAIPLCLLAAASHARVFSRWRSSSNSDAALTSLGGRRLYETAVKINGTPGDLSVFKFDDTHQQVTTRIGQAFNVASQDVPDLGTGTTALTNGNNVIRFTVIHIPGAAQTIVFKIVQSIKNAEHTRFEPDTSAIHAEASYPGSPPLLTIGLNKTGATLAAYHAQVGAEEASSFIKAAMRGAGWAPAFGSSSATTVYRKKNRLCYITITPSHAADTGTRITVLHKSTMIR